MKANVMLGLDVRNIHVLAICGSLNANSATRRALRVALHGAESVGARTSLVDLQDFHLPFAGMKRDPEEFPDVARLSEQVRSAQGILWGTPEYHGSYSGVLKNALDLMGFDEFEGKMIGLVGVAAGSIGAVHALDHLRTVGRQLHAWVLPSQVSVPRSYDAFTAAGGLKDPAIEKRLTELGAEVAQFARLHSTKAEEFVRYWETAAENPGGNQ